jgi:hypothetical protein
MTFVPTTDVIIGAYYLNNLLEDCWPTNDLWLFCESNSPAGGLVYRHGISLPVAHGPPHPVHAVLALQVAALVQFLCAAEFSVFLFAKGEARRPVAPVIFAVVLGLGLLVIASLVAASAPFTSTRVLRKLPAAANIRGRAAATTCHFR